MFGDGENAELGLGSKRGGGPGPTQVKSPALNRFLDSKTVGVIQIAVGGMHCVALTHDQKILTWGVNDSGALGRDTTWEEPTRDIDEDSDSGSDDSGLNPLESTPTAMPPESFGTSQKTFVQVAASNSASFAVTADGQVYGWGTFQVQYTLFLTLKNRSNCLREAPVIWASKRKTPLKPMHPVLTTKPKRNYSTSGLPCF